jgi:hypothetical protein
MYIPVDSPGHGLLVLSAFRGWTSGVGAMTELSLMQSLEEAMQSSSCVGDTVLFPSLLLTVSKQEIAETKRPGTTMADLAVGFFKGAGLYCERSKAIPTRGYPNTFRDLTAPPPWITVTPEDTEGVTSPQREQELRPLYLQANEFDTETLLHKLQEHLAPEYQWLERFRSALLAQKVIDHQIDAFEQKLALARCLGVNTFEAIWEVIADPQDDFILEPGIPDVFVWSQTPPIWLFAEVKGPRDSLRSSQVSWLKSNWETIRGRFVLVLIRAA